VAGVPHVFRLILVIAPEATESLILDRCPMREVRQNARFPVIDVGRAFENAITQRNWREGAGK
jgi:hypothetical protein